MLPGRPMRPSGFRPPAILRYQRRRRRLLCGARRTGSCQQNDPRKPSNRRAHNPLLAMEPPDQPAQALQVVHEIVGSLSLKRLAPKAGIADFVSLTRLHLSFSYPWTRSRVSMSDRNTFAFSRPDVPGHHRRIVVRSPRRDLRSVPRIRWTITSRDRATPTARGLSQPSGGVRQTTAACAKEFSAVPRCRVADHWGRGAWAKHARICHIRGRRGRSWSASRCSARHS